METINDFKDKAKAAHARGDNVLKAELEGIFGPKLFLSITDRVKSFEDACEENGSDPDSPYFSVARPHENAIRKMEEIVQALNEGEKLSSKNQSQDKWFVIMTWDGTRFRFYCADGWYSGTYAGLGSRLALKSEKLAKYFGTQFEDLINESLNEE